MSLINLKKFHDSEIFEFFNSFDTVIAICDSVLWNDDKPIQYAAEIMNTFKALGKQTIYVTNNSTFTREEILKTCERLNFNATEDEILCTSHLAATYLKKLDIKGKVYVIGSDGITNELKKEIPHCEILKNCESVTTKRDPEVKAVIVGFDDTFNLDKMKAATNYLKQSDTVFIGTNSDKRFLMEGIVVPGTGSIISCIEACAKRKAVIMGKPEKYLYDVIKENYNVNSRRTLLIGDDVNTDILFGKRCGFKTLLILSNTIKINRNGSPVRKDYDLIPDYIDTWENLYLNLMEYITPILI